MVVFSFFNFVALDPGEEGRGTRPVGMKNPRDRHDPTGQYAVSPADHRRQER
jgi:hypothetical protein